MRRFLRYSSALAAISMLVLPAMAADNGPVKIGLVAPQTGTMAVLGQQTIDGVNFAVEEHNAKAGDGRKFELAAEDAENNPDAARRAAERLVSKGHRVLIGQITTGDTLAITSQLDRWDAILFAVASKTDALTGKDCSPRMFRGTQSDAMDRVLFGPWLKERAEKKWGIIASDYVWGRSVAEGFAATAPGNGKEVVLQLFPPLGEKDYAPYLTQIQSSDVEGLWVAISGSDGINYVRQAREVGLLDKVTMAGVGYATYPSIQALGKDVLGAFGNLPYSASIDTPQNRAFVEAWRKKFGRDPVDYNGTSYNAMVAIMKAAEKANSSEPIEIAKALEDLEFESLYGTVKFRKEDHQLLMPNFIGRVEQVGDKIEMVVQAGLTAEQAAVAPSPDCKM